MSLQAGSCISLKFKVFADYLFILLLLMFCSLFAVSRNWWVGWRSHTMAVSEAESMSPSPHHIRESHLITMFIILNMLQANWLCTISCGKAITCHAVFRSSQTSIRMGSFRSQVRKYIRAGSFHYHQMSNPVIQFCLQVTTNKLFLNTHNEWNTRLHGGGEVLCQAPLPEFWVRFQSKR